MTPEAKVKKKVKMYLDKAGAYQFSPQSGIYGRSGIPDIVGCYKGGFFGIECKAGDNKATALQLSELAKIRNTGGVALLVNETNVDEVMLQFLGVSQGLII